MEGSLVVYIPCKLPVLSYKCLYLVLVLTETSTTDICEVTSNTVPFRVISCTAAAAHRGDAVLRLKADAQGSRLNGAVCPKARYKVLLADIGGSKELSDEASKREEKFVYEVGRSTMRALEREG